MKYITSIWTCLAVFTLLLGIRIIDPDPVERIRLISFDSKITSIPQKESDQIIQIQNILSRTLIAWLGLILLLSFGGILV